MTEQLPTEPLPADPPDPAPASFTRQHPTLMYTVSRVLLFLAVFGVLYLVGARDLVLLVLAFFLSGAISLVLLSRQRDAMSSAVTGTFSRMNERIEASKRVEDDD
jgi:TctA family transporter